MYEVLPPAIVFRISQRVWLYLHLAPVQLFLGHTSDNPKGQLIS